MLDQFQVVDGELASFVDIVEQDSGDKQVHVELQVTRDYFCVFLEEEVQNVDHVDQELRLLAQQELPEDD